MGCGQSKIGNIYTKNKKKKSNNTKQINDPTRSSSIDQKNGSAKNKANNNGVEVNRNEDQSGPIDNKNVPKKKATGAGNGPLQHQTEVSSSQVDFFRMLDEKIENGPDYDESVDTTVRAEHLPGLTRRWELESILWPEVAELTNTTVITTELSTNTIDESCDRLNDAKDRDTIRNIISGRSDMGPAFARNANRVDGLQNINIPPANMPRHVLESISQSPTQTLKYSVPAGTSSEFTRRYDDFIDDKNMTIVNKKALSRNNCQRNVDADDDYDPQAVHREQYLQQSGIISVQPQYQTGNIIRHNSYIQQFQTTNSDGHYQTTKNRSFNTVKMT